MRKSRQSTLRRVDYSMHFFCLDSGDWGHPSASIVCRFSRNLWERYTVLAEVEFCPLGASLFPSHQARYFCSLAVQGIASVLVKISVGVIGAELLSSYVSEHSNLKICNAEIPSLLGLIMPPWYFSVSESSGSVFLLTCGQ